MAISENLKNAQKKYRKKKDVKEKNAAKQRENFGNIAATFQKPEKEYIAAIFAAHGVKPAEVIRGAAAALRDGQTIRTERQALPIPADAAAYNAADAAQPAGDREPPKD